METIEIRGYKAIALFVVLIASCCGIYGESLAQAQPYQIAFASCLDDDQPDHPIWDALIDLAPDAMIFVGDNVYADTEEFRQTLDFDILRAEYAKLGNAPKFRQLNRTTRFLATWDDHDYGLNDGGVEFPLKDEVQELFVEFWNIDPDSERATTPGVYGSERLDANGIDIQVILLDARYFRTRTLLGEQTSECPLRNWMVMDDASQTMLGEAQWEWFEEQLSQPADIHLVVSGVQILPDEHCWEKWAQMPHERQRLLDTVEDSGAYVVLLSGDRHLGDISVIPPEASEGIGYPLYEATSSPLTARSGFGAGDPNRFRAVPDNVRQSNFGLLTIDQAGELRIELRGSEGQVLTGVDVLR